MGFGIVARNGATRVDSGSHVLVVMDGVFNGLDGMNIELQLLWIVWNGSLTLGVVWFDFSFISLFYLVSEKL